MFDHVRASIARELDELTARLPALTAERDAAHANVSTLPERVAEAGEQLANTESAVPVAADHLAAAEAALAAGQAADDDATVKRDRAQAQVDAHSELYPEPPTPAAVRQWQKLQNEIKVRLAAAQSTLDAATATLAERRSARDTASAASAQATAARDQARVHHDQLTAALAAAQARLDAAATELDETQAAVGPLQQQLDELDTLESRIAAEPLDRVGVEQAADVIYAELAERRQQLHDLGTYEQQSRGVRAALLAAHEATMDDLAHVADELRPTHGPIAARLDGAVRGDDLGDVRRRLHDAAQALADALAEATAERDRARTALEQAAHALAVHEERQP